MNKYTKIFINLFARKKKPIVHENQLLLMKTKKIVSIEKHVLIFLKDIRKKTDVFVGTMIS